MAKVNKRQIDAVDFSYIAEKMYVEGEYEHLITVIDQLADEYDIPEESVKRFLTPNLIQKLQKEAEEMGVIRKSSTAMFEF